MSRTHAGRNQSSQMSVCMTRTHAGRHSITHMAGRMLRLHARRHLVLLHVKLHVQLTCTATPRASVDTHLAGQLTPRSEPMQQATSSFSVHWPDFGPSAHTGRLWLSINTHISTLVLGLSTLALPVDCLGRRAHTARPWVSVSTHRTFVAVRVCPSAHTGRLWLPMWAVCSVHTGRPWVSASTHMTSVAVRVCPSAHTGCLWLSISTHISMLVLGLSMLALPVDCTGDFGPCGLSVQYTQDVRGCPPAHTGRLWLSVCVRQHTQDVCGCPSLHISARWSLESARRPCVSVSTHRLSAVVRQHTQDVCGCPCVSVNTHRTSVAVRVCPSTHTGRLWLSISTHVSTLVLGLSTLALPADRSGDFGPRGLSVQYTQDVCGCSGAHTGCLWVSISTQDVRGSLCVSVCVRVCPPTHTGRPWLSISTHISTLVLELSTLSLPVDCSGDFGPRGLSVQYTHDVRGWPPAHTGRPTSVTVLRLSTLALLVECSGDFGPRGLSVQYTNDVCGCPSAHKRRPWVPVSTHMTSVAVHHTHRTSVCVRQQTQDVRVCPSAHTGRPWLSISTHRTFVAVHQYTYQHAGPWTQHAGPSCGPFG
ncbi:hypothetical protein YC2023_004401 [Brassica napus]